jgi:uncharacterized membrane protein
MILTWIATVCAGLFAGAAVYVTFVEHPARLKCGAPLAVREFRPSYRRAARMQGALAVSSLLAAIGAWLDERDACVLVGGAIMGAMVPFTLVVILPTNKRLLDPALDPDSPLVAALLRRWGRLHAVRSAASVLAFAILAARLR